MISIILPKLHLRSKSDQLHSCLPVFPWLLCKQSIHIHPDLDPWTDFAAWPWISLITMDLTDGHRVARPTLFTITGLNPDHESLTCTPSCNLGPPLTPQTRPMTWTCVWTPSRPILSDPTSRPTLLTSRSYCGTAWWVACCQAQVPPLGSCWPSVLPEILEFIVIPEPCSLIPSSDTYSSSISLPQVKQAGIRTQPISPLLCPFLSAAPKTKV